MNKLVDFRDDRLSNLIDCSFGPALNPYRHANVTFYKYGVTFTPSCHANDPCLTAWDRPFTEAIILCKGIDWQVSHIAQVLTQLSATLSDVVHLKLKVQLKEDRQLEDTDDVEWLHLLYQFSTVQMLYVSQQLAGLVQVTLSLEEITEDMVADVLPSLDLIYLEGQPASTVEKFVIARRHSDHPVTVLDTQLEFDERLQSYTSRNKRMCLPVGYSLAWCLAST